MALAPSFPVSRSSSAFRTTGKHNRSCRASLPLENIMDLVPEKDLRNALANRLRDWSVQGKTLERTFHFSSFRDATGFVNKVADAAEEMNHHPDIHLSYDTVKIALTSHDAGGITYRDVTLAGRINEVAPQFAHPGKLRSA